MPIYHNGLDFRANARPALERLNVAVGSAHPWLTALRRNQLGIPAAPADVGVLPIPIETWIDFAVIEGDFAKAQHHTHKANKS